MGNKIKRGFESVGHDFTRGVSHAWHGASHFGSSQFHNFTRGISYVGHNVGHFGDQIHHFGNMVWHQTEHGFNKYISNPIRTIGKTVGNTVSELIKIPLQILNPQHVVRHKQDTPHNSVAMPNLNPSELAYKQEQQSSINSNVLYLGLAGAVVIVYLVS